MKKTRKTDCLNIGALGESEKKIKKALIKKALGFTVEEINEEYNFVENEPVLAKRKRSKKHYPPDLSAIQIVLANLDNFKELESLSVEQLEAEKKRLIKQLLKSKKGEGGNENN